MTRKIRVDTANMHRERWPEFAVPILAVKLRNSAFCGGYGRRGLDGSFRRCAEIVYCNVSLQGWRLDVRRVTRTGADWLAAPDGIFPAAWRVKDDATPRANHRQARRP